MDQRVFLRDIDDWELYAKGLEAHVCGWIERIDRSYVDVTGSEPQLWASLYGEMISTRKQAADRAQRLRDDREGAHR